MTQPTTVPELLRSLLDSDPARPLVTFYDDATGERVELSVKSFENWVAKTANLLQDELSSDPGEHVAVWLPAHWQSAVWVCAAAACALVVSTDDTDPGTQPAVDLVVCGPESMPAARDLGARDVVALSLRPMGQGFGSELPDGVTDYAASVLAQGDVFVPVGVPDGDAPFLLTGDGTRSQRELLDTARERADELGLATGGRLLTDANPADTAGLTGGLLAAMVTGGSVVLNRNTDPAATERRSAQEHVTSTWWVGR